MLQKNTNDKACEIIEQLSNDLSKKAIPSSAAGYKDDKYRIDEPVFITIGPPLERFDTDFHERYELVKKYVQQFPKMKATFDDKKMSITFYHHEKEVIDFLKFIQSKEETKKLVGGITLSRDSVAARGGFTVWKSSRTNFIQREKDFLKNAEENIKTLQSQKISIGETTQDPAQLLKNLLSKHQGVVMGEAHLDSFPKQLLMENFDALKKEGLTTLYLEHVFYDTMQPLIDAYIQDPDPNAKMPLQLERRLQGTYAFNNSDHNFYSLVVAAKQAKIRVVAIDTSLSYNLGTTDEVGVEDNRKRLIGMNITSKCIIEQDRTNSPGKYVALVGNLHVSSTPKALGVPGLAEILKVPSVCIDTIRGESDEIKYNQSNYLGTIDFTSAVITKKSEPHRTQSSRAHHPQPQPKKGILNRFFGKKT